MIRNRLFVVFVIFVVLFFGVLVRAFHIQVISNDELISYSNSQTLRFEKNYPNRGRIFDRNGYDLAINVQTYSLFTIPKLLRGDYRPYQELAKIAPVLSYEKIRRRIRNRKHYTWLARKIELSKDQVDKIKELPGIYIDSVPKRIYPNHELLSQAIGFVGVDNKGLAGLEYLFDKELQGKPRIIKYLRDAKGRAIKFESQEVGNDAKDLHLSIDKDLQAVSERILKEAVIKNEAFRGGIGIMDPDNGEILAIANYPTFDGENYKQSNTNNRKLAFVTDPFEPGSSFKVFTVAAAIENKIIRPDTNYYCEKGRFRIGSHFIGEADPRKQYEWLSVKDILKYSSNIGTTKIAFDLTFSKFNAAMDFFRFGQKTNVEVPGESRGIYNFQERASNLSLSNMSFGQGLATTGIQMLAAYSAFANGGYYIEPTLLLRKNKIVPKKRIISKPTADALTDMLISVVDEGTGTNAKIKDFVIAGKTSTAQRADNNGGYKGYIAGFIGYPVNVDKKFVLYVYIDNPQGPRYYGNSIAAPVFKEVAEYILYKNKEYKGLTETQNFSEEDKRFDEVKTEKSATRIINNETVPNFIGLDKISANQLASKLKINLIHKGVGIVKKQSQQFGNKLLVDSYVILNYETPKYE